MKKLNEIIELALLEQGVFVETDSNFKPLDDETADAVCSGLINDHSVDKFKARFIKSCLKKGKLIKDLGMFNNKQVYQLCRAMNKGLDYSIFADHQVSSYAMEKLIDLKLKGVDLETFYYPSISCYILKVIEICIDNNLDYTKLLTKYLKKEDCERLEKILPIAASQKLEEDFYVDLVVNNLNYLDSRFFWMADAGYRLDHALKVYSDFSSWLNELKSSNVTADEFEQIYKMVEDNDFKRDYPLGMMIEAVRANKTIEELLGEAVDEEVLKENELRLFLNSMRYAFSDDVIKDLMIYTSFEDSLNKRRFDNPVMSLGHSIPSAATMRKPLSRPETKKSYGGKVFIREDLINFLYICPEFLELRSKPEAVSTLSCLFVALMKDDPQDVAIDKMKLLIAERPSVLESLNVRKAVSVDPDLTKDKTISDEQFLLLFNNYHRTDDYDALKTVSYEFLAVLSKRNMGSHPSDWPAFVKLYELNISDKLIDLAICNFAHNACQVNEGIVDIIGSCVHFKEYDFNNISHLVSLIKYGEFDIKQCAEILKSSHSAYYAKVLIGASSLGLDISGYLSKKMAPLTVREKLLEEALLLGKVKDRKEFYRVVS